MYVLLICKSFKLFPRVFCLGEYLPSKATKNLTILFCKLSTVLQVGTCVLDPLARRNRLLVISASVFEIRIEVQSSDWFMLICVKPSQVIIEFSLADSETILFLKPLNKSLVGYAFLFFRIHSLSLIVCCILYF